MSKLLAATFLISPKNKAIPNTLKVNNRANKKTHHQGCDHEKETHPITSNPNQKSHIV